MEINADILNAVEKFLSDKTFTLGYKFETRSNFFDTELYHFEVLSQEDLNLIHSLFDKYAENEIHEHLDDIFEADKIDDLSCGDELTGIDLDNPHKLYRFKTHNLLTDGSLHQRQHLLPLPDGVYKKLLLLSIEDQYLNYNSLEYADHELYQTLKEYIDDSRNDFFYYENESPFLVTFDELQEDVEKILADHPDWRDFSITSYPISSRFPKRPLKYLCTVTVSHRNKPTTINDVRGVLYGTVKGIMEKIPSVAVHSSHYPYLQELLFDSDRNEKEWGRHVENHEIHVDIPEEDLSYDFEFFHPDFHDDDDRIVSSVSVLYDDADMAEEGLPFKIIELFTHRSENETTNQGRLAFPSKDFYLNAL